ncbi:uncharacterized protein LOC142784514 isoform X2 [Rhipicephalus microplus]|uniref:uncharacterized protein LOC142784514 isoform X2 n=1 Tax=Rhipicephalus microplus TaxID=6941 RepID=UPI003F6BDDEE
MLVSRKAYRAKCATTLEVSEKAALWIELAEQIFLEDLAKKCRKMVIKQGKKGKKTLRRRDVARAYQTGHMTPWRGALPDPPYEADKREHLGSRRLGCGTLFLGTNLHCFMYQLEQSKKTEEGC